MQWLQDYQLFLFDFDGLLVNSEEIHYQAYQNMCAKRGIRLDWDFNRYCQAAHYEADALKKQLYDHFPELKAQEPDWGVLYTEKKEALRQLFQQGAVQLMPGAASFLKLLQQANKPRAVVTHSPDDLVGLIRTQNSILESIPYWITRECYAKPKPDPECYLKAIELYAKERDRIIGFEDTPRGINALMGTRAQPVLVCKAHYPEVESFTKKGVLHFSSFEDFLE